MEHEMEATAGIYPELPQWRGFPGESTASEDLFSSLMDAVQRHEEMIEKLELNLHALGAVVVNLDFVIREIGERLNKLESIERKIEQIESKLEQQEAIIVVKEISFEEAKKMVEDYLSSKKGEIVTPLEIADTLQIPYETAHEIFLQLIDEGKLEIKDIEEEY